MVTLIIGALLGFALGVYLGAWMEYSDMVRHGVRREGERLP